VSTEATCFTTTAAITTCDTTVLVVGKKKRNVEGDDADDVIDSTPSETVKSDEENETDLIRESLRDLIRPSSKMDARITTSTEEFGTLVYDFFYILLFLI
jgi:hypothetical protein